MRRIIQICEANGYLWALCEDGTLWHRRLINNTNNSIWIWQKVEGIPQDGDKV